MGDFFNTFMQATDAIMQRKEQLLEKKRLEDIQRQEYLKMAPFIRGTAENRADPRNQQTPMEMAQKQRQNDIYFGLRGRRQF